MTYYMTSSSDNLRTVPRFIPSPSIISQVDLVFLFQKRQRKWSPHPFFVGETSSFKERGGGKGGVAPGPKKAAPTHSYNLD